MIVPFPLKLRHQKAAEAVEALTVASTLAAIVALFTFIS